MRLLSVALALALLTSCFKAQPYTGQLSQWYVPDTAEQEGGPVYIGDPRLAEIRVLNEGCTKQAAVEFGQAFDSQAGRDAVILCMAEHGYRRRGLGPLWYGSHGF